MDFETAEDSFILFLATERGLSENYQLSVKQTLLRFSHWLSEEKKEWSKLTTDQLSQYLGVLKSDSLKASSIRIHLVHLIVF